MRVDKIIPNTTSLTPSIARPKLAELPITFRLPRSGGRDPHFGLSRSWYYNAEVDGGLTMIRLRAKGKSRGTTLIRTADVLALIGGEA